MSDEKSADDQLAEIAARRKKRAEDLEAQRKVQEVKDLLAIEALEERLGVEGFVFVRLNAYAPGLPTLAAARDAVPVELKRYRQTVDVETRNQVTKVKGSNEAAETLASTCLEYPDAETYKKMCDARNGLGASLGQEIVSRAQAKSDADAKK